MLNLKPVRLQKGMSMTQLAEKSGISKAYLSQLEAGAQENPSLEVLRKLAVALETTIGDLIGGEVATPAAEETSRVEDPGLQSFLAERRKQGRPLPSGDVQLLLRLQWRGGSRGERPRSKEQWAFFYKNLLPMWDRGIGGDDEG